MLNHSQLVQTGKALRASRRDSQGNLPPSQGVLQPKLPDTIRAFHSALDDLENDIVRMRIVPFPPLALAPSTWKCRQLIIH